jgi:hypothetical protein
MTEVVKKEVLKLLKAGVMYPISDSEWVSLVHVVPKKCGMTVIRIKKNELISQRTVIGWQMCIDYQQLNKATRKDHFPLPFIDEMLERLANHSFFCYPRWLLWLSTDPDPSKRLEQDHLHMSIWHFRIQANVIWTV